VTYPYKNESRTEYYSFNDIKKQINVGDIFALNIQTLNTILKNGCWKKWEDLEYSLEKYQQNGIINYNPVEQRYTAKELDLISNKVKAEPYALCCRYQSFHTNEDSISYNIIGFSFLIEEKIYNFFIFYDEIFLIKTWKKIS